jgi:hypothetical protein
MIAQQTYGAHSAEVEMRLILNGKSVSIRHMGSYFVLIDPVEDHPPGEAIILVRIDQAERRWTVRPPNGISSKSNRVDLAVKE